MALEKILVVGKDIETQQLARPFTKQLFSADDIHDIWETIDHVEPHLVVFDPNVPHDHICSFLKKSKKRSLLIPSIAIGTQQEQSSNGDSLLDLGIFDCLQGKDPKLLGKVIDRIKAIAADNNSGDNDFFSDHCPPSVRMVGTSPAINRSIEMMRLVAQSSCNPVLIVGETGTGKELAAQAVHTIRHGSNAKFVAVNCAALTANLLESELFGHVKGSFTSADREKTGLLELAGDGTIFLDEISEMPLELQAKLLRVLQEKIFRKVGGIKDILCKATIIASSNRNLLKDVDEGKFRRDLYYRLSICPITLAPLRSEDRSDDILLLAKYFIKNSTICPEKTGKIKGLTKLAAENLKKHLWPGNVRELRNVIERAIMLEKSDKIGLTNLHIHPEQFMEASASAASAPTRDFSLERAEKELVAKALDEAGWQKTRAAAMLGITRATLYAKVKQYNIQAPQTKVAVTA